MTSKKKQQKKKQENILRIYIGRFIFNHYTVLQNFISCLWLKEFVQSNKTKVKQRCKKINVRSKLAR